MATAQQIITAALRKTGVIAQDEQPVAHEAANGLEALNGMLHEWKLRGVDLTHTDYELTTPFALGNEYRDGVVYMLAARMSPDYMVPQHFDADDYFRAIQVAYLTIPTTTIPVAVRQRKEDAV